MDERTLTLEQIMAYGGYLRTEERAPGTIEKYLRDARSFAVWLDGAPVTKENATGWKEQLRAQGYAPATINSMLAALNNLFRFLGWNECHMKFLKIQRKLFRDTARELTRTEYEQLIRTAEAQGKHRLALLMETICATGVRVSEVKYLTVEAARTGCAEISLKGKIRTILLPNKLCRKLLKYAKKQKNRFRRDLSHQKRKRAVPPPDLGGDEAAVCGGGRGAVQGVPPQSAPPVCQACDKNFFTFQRIHNCYRQACTLSEAK